METVNYFIFKNTTANPIYVYTALGCAKRMLFYLRSQGEPFYYFIGAVKGHVIPSSPVSPIVSFVDVDSNGK